jgi:predicted amidohydrolase YtcJ
MARNGIAWVQDAWVEQADVDGWIAAAASGDLAFRVDLGLWSDPNTWRDQLDGFVESRRRVQQADSPLLTANTVKFFADGVIESGTGALLEPYCDCPHSKGLPNWTPEELIAAVCAVDALGFNPHIHAIGDAAARMALDAIEAAIASNPARDRRPVIAHAQLVAASDLQRFAALGVTANFEPYWAKRDDLMTVLTEPRLGPARTAEQYRIRSLLDLGARVSFGSDWPVTTVVPLEGVQVAVTRMASPDDTPFIPEERVSVEEALTAYTHGVGVQRGDDGGLLVSGAPADLVLLAADPRSVDPLAIGAIEVRGTWVGGRRTWDASGRA